jgi:hypothetical protein
MAVRSTAGVGVLAGVGVGREVGEAAGVCVGSGVGVLVGGGVLVGARISVGEGVFVGAKVSVGDGSGLVVGIAVCSIAGPHPISIIISIIAAIRESRWCILPPL